MSDAVTESEVQSYRDRTHTERLTIQLRHRASELWPYMSDTDSINRKVGFGGVAYTFVPRQEGGSRLLGASRLGGFPAQYEERPFEWVEPRWIHVERIFARGPLRYIDFLLELEDRADGCRATLALSWVGRWLPSPIARGQIGKQIRRHFQAYREIDTALDRRQGFDARTWGGPTRPEARPVEDLIADWSGLAPGSPVPREIAQYIYATPDAYLARMRPHQIARLCGLDRQETLRFFLLAVKEGYLDMSWDVLCPGCRGAKGRSSHLLDVTAKAHCEACNIDFGVSLAANIELTFQPSARVFPVEKTQYCAGGPHATRHVRAQITVDSGATRRLEMELAPGSYRLRGPAVRGELGVEVAEDGEPALSVDLGHGLGDGAVRLAPGSTLDLSNTGESAQTVRVEHLYWREEAVTAEYVTTLQDFRDLFGAEVLRAGLELGVSNLVFFFSDLKGSTDLYDRHGDSRAFGLVQDHFGIMTEVIRKYGGGIVKTIGDAVMATFTDPVRAVTASLVIQRRFARLAAGSPEDFRAIVKIGLHRGPAIAMTLNERFDYFGATVNKAARVQHESVGGDIVISAELLGEPAVRQVLRKTKAKVTLFRRELKGITGSAELYRVHPAPPEVRASQGPA